MQNHLRFELRFLSFTNIGLSCLNICTLVLVYKYVFMILYALYWYTDALSLFLVLLYIFYNVIFGRFYAVLLLKQYQCRICSVLSFLCFGFRTVTAKEVKHIYRVPHKSQTGLMTKLLLQL